jgi:hypothetical protein
MLVIVSTTTLGQAMEMVIISIVSVKSVAMNVRSVVVVNLELSSLSSNVGYSCSDGGLEGRTKAAWSM